MCDIACAIERRSSLAAYVQRLSTVGMADSLDGPIPYSLFTENGFDEEEIENKRMSLWERLSRSSDEASSVRSQGGASDTASQVSIDTSNKSESETKIIMQLPKAKAKPKPKLRRFRTLARMIKNNLAWTKEMASRQDDTQAFVVKSSGAANPLVFDLNYFRASANCHAGINNRVRHILVKHPLARTPEERHTMLIEVINRLGCFQRFPARVKEDLVGVCYYDRIGHGRMIIKQGHIGVSFYFIMSGQVEVLINVKDELGNTYSQHLGYLTTGCTFGELALMHNIKRTANIVSKGVVELLRVDKDDFEEVLYSNYKQEHIMRLDALRAVPFVKKWSEKDLEICNNVSILKEYPANTIIIGDCRVQADTIHFIVSGECKVLKRIWMLYEISQWGDRRVIAFLSREKYHKWKETHAQLGHSTNSTKTYYIKERIWQISVLKKGLYFGVGEDLTDTYIVTAERVEVLLVPSTSIVKAESSRRLRQMCEDLDAALPTVEQVFKVYKQEKLWRSYKGKVIQDLLKQKHLPDIKNKFGKSVTYHIKSHLKI